MQPKILPATFTGIYPQTCIRHSITPPQQALRRGIGLRRRYEEVGTAGFEPATSAPPERCATELRHVPNKHESIMEESKTGSVGAPLQRMGAVSSRRIRRPIPLTCSLDQHFPLSTLGKHSLLVRLPFTDALP